MSPLKSSSQSSSAGTPQTAERLEARRAALAVVKARYAALRRIHRSIASEFARMDQRSSDVLVTRALRTVAAWERSGVASLYYVRAWRRILKDPANRIPKIFRGHNTNALVQNTPFGFLFSRPEYRKALWPGDE
ncbi:hypothetical protein [Stenotrophomonas rhizophila]